MQKSFNGKATRNYEGSHLYDYQLSKHSFQKYMILQTPRQWCIE